MSQALRDEGEEFDLFSQLEPRVIDAEQRYEIEAERDAIAIGSGDALDRDDEPELLPDETPRETQLLLLDVEEPWRKLWKNMPEYSQQNLAPFRSVIVHFASLSDMLAFSELISKKLTLQTKSTWFPPIENQCFQNLRWGDEDQS